jgi:hypothetical protein
MLRNAKIREKQRNPTFMPAQPNLPGLPGKQSTIFETLFSGK